MPLKMLLIAVAVLHLALGASIGDVMCPDSCTCEVKDEYLETSCSSSEFIKKLKPKQVSTIVRLNINNASLVNIDSKLKYLKNLHSLDLSHNNIASLPSQFPYLPKLRNLNLSNNFLTNLDFAQLPKNLQVVDLSNNSIGNFPKDWTSLKQLKTLHFHDNPIDCDCDNLFIYEQLLEGGIDVPENLTCYYPKEFHGKSLKSVNCALIKENLLNSMLGDEAGSGLDELQSHDELNSPLSDDQEELIMAEGVTTRNDDLDEEGSGEEGSGHGIIPIVLESEPKACHFNCSTTRPVGMEDEENASSLPDLKEQVGIVFGDILGGLEDDEKTTTPTAAVKEVEEDDIVKKTDKSAVESSVNNTAINSEVELVPTNDTVVGQTQRASVEGASTQSVYIIVGLLIAFVAFLAIYVINKRRSRKRKNQRKRNKSNENGFGEELKPLGKSAEVGKSAEQINSKPPNAEAAPLLNGQNGKISDDNVKPPVEEDLKGPEQEVEMRDKTDKEELLTPQLERVTIKAAEIPDSVPKTPLLVHRQLNSDGEIVTTAVNSN